MVLTCFYSSAVVLYSETFNPNCSFTTNMRKCDIVICASGVANYTAVTIFPKVGQYCPYNSSTPDKQVWREARKCYLNAKTRQLDLDVFQGLDIRGGPHAFGYESPLFPY